MTLRVGFLASHGGTTAEVVMNACEIGSLRATTEVGVVISNNSQSLALAKARQSAIAAVHLSGKTHPDPAELDAAMLATLEAHDVELVVLAGYLKPLGPLCIERYQRRAINLHPALLPAYGGQGMYGDSLYEAVLASGDPETGVTIHHVSAEYDAGGIIAQMRIPVRPHDTVESLRARVQPVEAQMLVDLLALLAGEGAVDRLLQ